MYNIRNGCSSFLTTSVDRDKGCKGYVSLVPRVSPLRMGEPGNEAKVRSQGVPVHLPSPRPIPPLTFTHSKDGILSTWFPWYYITIKGQGTSSTCAQILFKNSPYNVLISFARSLWTAVQHHKLLPSQHWLLELCAWPLVWHATTSSGHLIHPPYSMHRSACWLAWER